MSLKNWVHKEFQLNGRSFSDEKELLEFSASISNALYTFLSDWFSEKSFVSVTTSGSTGKPKNIELQKEFMKNSAQATGALFQIGEKTKALCCLPIDFIAGKMMLVRAMTLGWHIDVVAPSSSPLEGIHKKYDFSAMVPLQVRNSLEKLDQVRKLIVGGGVVSFELQQQLQQVSTQVYATYGMTETITHIAVKKMNHGTWNHYQTLPNVAISTDDRNCLVIDAPKVSKERVVTNDVVKIISSNEFEWKGRYDNVINSGGIKLHPEEIERKLSEFIENRFFVAGIADEELGEKLVLVIESEAYSISENIFSNLSKYEKPKQIYFVKEFVETETKKIQRNKTLDLI